jgi:hypothetical protein
LPSGYEQNAGGSAQGKGHADASQIKMRVGVKTGQETTLAILLQNPQLPCVHVLRLCEGKFKNDYFILREKNSKQ